MNSGTAYETRLAAGQFVFELHDAMVKTYRGNTKTDDVLAYVGGGASIRGVHSRELYEESSHCGYRRGGGASVSTKIATTSLMTCPITLDLMIDPVLDDDDDEVYVRSAILEHIKTDKKSPVDRSSTARRR